MDLCERCPTCPIRDDALAAEIVVWAWFDMVVDQANGILPVDDAFEAARLLDSASAQGDVVLAAQERPAAVVATQALVRCFRARATGQCQAVVAAH